MTQEEKKQWKEKMQEFLSSCQGELLKTTEIGKKMFNASKTNSCLRECYEELGRLAIKDIKAGRLEWPHPRVRELVDKVQFCEESLQEIEEEMNSIKKK